MVKSFEKQFKSILNQLESNIDEKNTLDYLQNITEMFGSMNSIMATLNNNVDTNLNESDDEFTKIRKAEKKMRLYLLYIKSIDTIQKKFDEVKNKCENICLKNVLSEDELIIKHIDTDFNDEEAYNYMKEELNDEQIELVRLTKLEILELQNEIKLKELEIKKEDKNNTIDIQEIPIYNISNTLDNSLNNEITSKQSELPNIKPKKLDIKAQFKKLKKSNLSKHRKKKK